jgi:hypothetical protein
MNPKQRSRWSSRSLAAALMALALGAPVGCSSSDNCEARYSGNYEDSVSTAPGCGKLAPSSANAGDWELQLTSTSVRNNVTLSVQIDVGSSPAPGSFSSENVAHWQAVGASNQNCEYSAGDQSVPVGNFTLMLASVPALSGAGGVAHGTLQLQQYVQAPPTVDCGPGDSETVDFEF